MSDMPKDSTIHVLREIRDELRDTKRELTTEIRKTNERLDATNDHLALLERRVVASEVRTATAIADLAGTVREMTSFLRASSELRPRLERCESAIAELQKKVG